MSRRRSAASCRCSPRRAVSPPARSWRSTPRHGRNLELAQTLAGERRGSLLAAIDRTVTGAGARLLAEHLAAPLTDVAAIAGRLDMVQFFHAGERLREDLRQVLRHCPDIARALSRLTLGRGGPRDLAALRDTLGETAGLRRLLGGGSVASELPHSAPELVLKAVTDLGEHAALVDRLTRALAPDLPLLTRDGGFVAEGYSAELDELRLLRDQSRRMMAQLQARYAGETGVAGLKIRHNNVLGYYIEVTPQHAPKLTADGGRFIHRQTMASAMRFTTVELGEIESRIASAADKALALELAFFDDLVGEGRGARCRHRPGRRGARRSRCRRGACRARRGPALCPPRDRRRHRLRHHRRPPPGGRGGARGGGRAGVHRQ